MNIDYEEILLEWSYRLPKGFPTIADGKFGNREEVIILNQILQERGLKELHLPEASVKVLDLTKLNKQQQERGQVLLNKINTEQPLTLTNGSTIVVDKSKSKEFINALKTKKYSTIPNLRFYAKGSGTPLKLSSLLKTPELGSSRGMGGGAEQTATQESAQCLVNALRTLKGKDLVVTDLKPSNLSKAAKLTDTTQTLQEMLKFLGDNPKWAETCVNTANVLAKTFKKSYRFYRGKGIVEKIQQAALKALKGAGVTANLNKWNPADIWMATDKVLSTEFPTELEKLNKVIKDLFNKQELVGVSLKKCVSGCDIEIYGTEDKSKITNKFVRVAPKDKDPFKTKDIYLDYDDGRIQFRNFGDVSSWQGEIKGKEAAGGKIGHSAVSGILTQLGQPGLSSQKEVLAKSNADDPTLINDLYKKYAKTSSLSKISKNDFIKAFEKAPLGNRTSNFFNIEFLSQFDALSPKQKHQFISNLIGYAKSSASFSSVFVKVS